MHLLDDHPSASKYLLGAYSEGGSGLHAWNTIMDRDGKGKNIQTNKQKKPILMKFISQEEVTDKK